MKKVLIVEDNLINRMMLGKYLEKNGFVAETACNGIDAMDQIQADNLPDLIVTDLKMPYMNGYQFLRMLRENEPTSQVPIIAMTAYEEISRAELGEHNFNLLLYKPFPLEKLLKVIKNFFENEEN